MTRPIKRKLVFFSVQSGFLILIAALIFPPLFPIIAVIGGLAIGARAARYLKERPAARAARLPSAPPADHGDFNQTRGY